MHIRQAELDDIFEMSHVFYQGFKHTYKGLFSQRFLAQLTDKSWIERLKKGILSQQTTYHVCEINAQIVGVIGFGAHRFKPSGSEIYALYVLPAYQKQGVGKELLFEAIAQLKRQYHTADVYVVKGNQRAKAFYERCGFIDVHENKVFQQVGGAYDTHLLTYHLRD